MLARRAIRFPLIFSSLFYPSPCEQILKQAFDYGLHTDLPGDYLEFGVWKGRSFATAFHVWKYVKRNKQALQDTRFFAFDSFEGLPEPTLDQDKSTGEFKKGQYACSEKEFVNILQRERVDLADVIMVKGWYKDSLTDQTKQKHALHKVAIVFIDCDLYESTVSVLEFITDLLVDGTVIIFDDWFCFRGNPEAGEMRAFTEWLARHPEFQAVEYQRFNWRGNSFLIHCRTPQH